MQKSRTYAAALGLVAALALTGCGGSDGGDGGDGGKAKAEAGFTDKSGADIAQAAKDDMKELESVKFAGDITQDGKDTSLDIQVSSSGDCTGSVTVDDATAEVLSAGDTFWIKPDEAFWKLQVGDSADAIIDKVGDKWVTLPAGDNSFAAFCNIDDLLDQLLSDDSDASYEKGDVEEVDGEDAIAVTRTNADDDSESVGYVRVAKGHYLVKIERTKGDDTGTVTFSEFDEDFTAEAPAADDQIDAAELDS